MKKRLKRVGLVVGVFVALCVLGYAALLLNHQRQPLGSQNAESDKRSFGLLPDTNSPTPQMDTTSLPTTTKNVDVPKTNSPTPIKNIEWEAAVELMKSGQVMYGDQSHSLGVTLITTNGDCYSTKEPRIDEVFKYRSYGFPIGTE